MKVSVIIPFYGVEAFIDHCARSLLEQTWQDIEFIFVNDGTQDRSMEILTEVLAQYPDRAVKIIEQPNAGLPQARLSGLRQASGEYVLHVDSDDWLEPDMVEKMARAAQADDADMVYCYAIKEMGNGKRRLIRDGRYADCPSFARDMLQFRAHGYLWNKLIRRSLFRKDLFNPTIGMHEDMVLLAQVLGLGRRCVRVPEVLYHYRRDNAGTISQQQKNVRDVDSARSFLQLYAFWKDRADIPFRPYLPWLFLRCGWIASRYAPALLDEFPFLREKLLLLSGGDVCHPKWLWRLHKVRSWLRSLPFHSKRILCCIFNYNENDKAIAWSERLSPCFDTVILDSGSQPPCDHPTALHLNNIFYSGLMNEAYRLASEGCYPWVVIVTSDVGISDKGARALCRRMEKLSYAENVGLYQPGNSLWGTSHSKSRARLFGGIRKSNFQEGWFHLVRTDLLGRICPIDLSINRLGWGLDMALCYFANIEDKLILVDSDITVRHPGGTGYNRDEADRQMQAWFTTIPGFRDPFHMPKANGPIRYPKL